MTCDGARIRVGTTDRLTPLTTCQEQRRACRSWTCVKGAVSPLSLSSQLLPDSCGLAQQPEGWDRWAGAARAHRRTPPPTAPVLVVGEALVPDGWEDSVGIEL